MQLEQLQPGKYVVAVSGGVDSMVLLDLLRQQPELELVVAHFDHGIRPDSAKDLELVRRMARQYGLKFVSEQGNLGPDTSEAAARAARYVFLRRVQKEKGARAIVTAHHQDDVLETAIINMFRGTGRKGLTALTSRPDVIRPLLECTKQDIQTYASAHGLIWREDTTNADERYLRNYIRHTILPRFSESDKRSLLGRIKHARQMNDDIDRVLDADLQSHATRNELERPWFARLPYVLSCEVMAMWLCRHGISGFDRRLIERLVTAAKTAKPGKLADVDRSHTLEFGKQKVKLVPRNHS